jgi:uncharacterized protein (DUF1015 family)
MAEVVPFRGLRYNLEKIPDLNLLVTPPYDVISPSEQKAFHQLNPYNMIHLELGLRDPGDNAQHNPHTRAAEYLQTWQKERILIRESEPVIYCYTLSFSLAPDIRQTRHGFICALRLEDFRTGGVRPHEKTFRAVREERLQLMLACHADLSPIFALYDDPARVIDHHLQQGRESEPCMAFRDAEGMEHRLWRVSDPKVLRQVRALMLDKPIFIADGHHRYETALAYRDLQRELLYGAGKLASFEYVMIYLSNMNQSGVTILPTHRMLRHLGSWQPEPFLAQAEQFFECSSFAAGVLAPGEVPQAWREAVGRGEKDKETRIGFYSRDNSQFYALKAKRDAISAYLSTQDLPRLLHHLDVVVVDQIILRRLMGLSESFLADENNIHFRHDWSDALTQLQSGYYDAGFFINPTRIEQVREVASAGLIMPHKSTYFYPKVMSGLVINPLPPAEEMLW